MISAAPVCAVLVRGRRSGQMKSQYRDPLVRQHRLQGFSVCCAAECHSPYSVGVGGTYVVTCKASTNGTVNTSSSGGAITRAGSTPSRHLPLTFRIRRNCRPAFTGSRLLNAG